MKRIATLLLALLFLLTACTAAPSASEGSDAPASTSSAEGEGAGNLEPYVMTVLYPGDITPRMESFIAGEFNQRMTEELNLTVEISYSPWGEYFNKLDLMLSSGEGYTEMPEEYIFPGSVLPISDAAPIQELPENERQEIQRLCRDILARYRFDWEVSHHEEKL